MTDFTHQPTVWVPLSDGTRLAASIWMPDGDGPFPAILEYLPYRRADQTAARDQSTYPAFARAGIAGVRLDSRGQGDSQGLFDDEYSPQELSDASEVIAWIAEQDWSNGAVGMMGISWGGFNALQVAALRPPALKAVISIASTADRYNDDIHYKGGCLLSANISWAAQMLAWNARPPDPAVVGDGWDQIWRTRLDAQPLLLEPWLQHQRRDAYWQHGSICQDWSAIDCPVWVIAGWGDGYRNCPATLARHLRAPVKAMTGPWIHKYPHFAAPKPQADFLGMAVAWWRQWLCAEDHDVAAWPDYSAYMVEAARPDRWREADTGRWIGTGWPDRSSTSEWALGDDGALGAPASGPVKIATRQHCGTMAGEFFTSAPDADLPADQNADDALSVCWETAPADTPVDVLGRPVLKLRVAIDRPQGNLIARLIDVHPDGTAALIARGVLNLCHRHGNETPEPMTPGSFEAIDLPLDETGYRLRAGHRLRLALSTAYWPLVQPSPAPVTATIAPGAVLCLPHPEGASDIVVPEPPQNTFPTYPIYAPGHSRRWVEHDLTGGRVRYALSQDTGHIEVPWNQMQFRETRTETWEIDPDDPLSSTGILEFTSRRARGDWTTRVEARIWFSCTSQTWDIRAELLAFSADAQIARREWSLSVPRDHL